MCVRVLFSFFSFSVATMKLSKGRVVLKWFQSGMSDNVRASINLWMWFIVLFNSYNVLEHHIVCVRSGDVRRRKSIAEAMVELVFRSQICAYILAQEFSFSLKWFQHHSSTLTWDRYFLHQPKQKRRQKTIWFNHTHKSNGATNFDNN